MQTTNLTSPNTPVVADPQTGGQVAAPGAAPDASAAPPVQANALAAEPAPAAQPAEPVVKRANPTPRGYPNINVVPAREDGKTLTPDARQKAIDKLNKLREQQSGSSAKPTKATSDLAKEAQNHGAEALEQIEKCSQEDTSGANPECGAAAPQ